MPRAPMATGSRWAALADCSGTPDDQIAAEIRRIGRDCIRRGERVSLAELMEGVPDLRRNPASLDAAIDIALRSASGSSVPTDHAVEALISSHPDLAEPIRTAAVLSRALWSSEAMAPDQGSRTRAVPSEFGPVIDDGRPRYTLEAVVGVGSTGAVYRAVDRSLSASGRRAMVAVKVLHETRSDPVSRARFLDEASKARVLDHAHAVRVFDRGESVDGSRYIVYELVDGGDLHGWVASHGGPVPIRDAAVMVEGIADAIQAAHSAGLVHLDLKPANVLVTRDGTPKVADFGLAMHGASDDAGITPGSDRAIGTLAFMPPEQYLGAPGWAAPRADVYALGGILLWMVTGALPNGGTHAEIRRILGERADREATAARIRTVWTNGRPDRDLIAICARALAWDPNDRYSTAAELAADLCAWREHRTIRWMRPGPIRTTVLFTRRRPATVALMVVCVASIGGALVASERARDAAAARSAAEAIALAQTERAEEVERWRRIAQDGVRDLHRSVTENTKSGLEGDMLLWAWYLESLYGPSMMDDPAHASTTRAARIAATRTLAAKSVESGGAESMQALLVRTLLGYLLARDHQLEEADRVLAEVEPVWRARVSPSDPWLADVELIRLTVSAGLEVARLGGVKPVGEDRRRLVEIERQLRAHDQRVAKVPGGTQLRKLILERLRQMYGPMCFADADWEKWSVETLRFLGEDPVPDRIATGDDPDGSDALP